MHDHELRAMNYAEARQIPGRGWHWTTMRDGKVRPAAPCLTYIGDPGKLMSTMAAFDESDWVTCEPHPTKADAERHFYEHSISEARVQKWVTWMACEICDAPTREGYGTNLLSLGFANVPLCERHLSEEHLRAVRPFKEGIAIVHS